MSLFALETCRSLFASDEAMVKFADLLMQATEEGDTPMVTLANRHIATALSRQATERLLSDRILRKFVEKPELLETFVKRLQNLKDEDLVD
jgi:hypothetical protein